jgi:hypothetical protein
MNWQHKDAAIIGAMYAVEARDLQGNSIEVDDLKDDESFEIVIQGAVWHHLPHIKTTADQIIQRINEENLFVSMECWFDNYNFGFYTESGELYDLVPRNSDTAFLERHLRANGGTGKYSGMRIGRALVGINFGGIAFVDRPANKRSYILNHFAFDPNSSLEEVGAHKNDNQDPDPIVLNNVVNDVQNVKPIMEVSNMNDLNRAAASADEIQGAVKEALDARDRVEASKRDQETLEATKTRNTALEAELKQANSALSKLQTAIDTAFAGATANTPSEIAKVDQALQVKGDGAGDAVYAAKVAWIEESRQKTTAALAAQSEDKTNTELVEKNAQLAKELAALKGEIRQVEINYLFADKLGMDAEEVAKFVEAGIAIGSDEEYKAWMDEKMLFAKKILELQKAGAADSEAGLLSPSQRETSIDDEGATLRSEHGRVPSSVTLVPRSKLTAAANIDALFEEVDEPNLAGASADEGAADSPMGTLVAGLLDKPNKDNN